MVPNWVSEQRCELDPWDRVLSCILASVPMFNFEYSTEADDDAMRADCRKSPPRAVLSIEKAVVPAVRAPEMLPPRSVGS